MIKGKQQIQNPRPYVIGDVRHYPNFEAMVAAESLASIAPDLSARSALLAACRAIYPPEKEALGVVALELRAAS